jgi:glycosyltransferase involved in cell wall biosynthesis
VLLATLNRADTLIAPSHFLAQLYIRYGINPDLIKVWRQGVNLSFCPLRESSPILRFSYLGQIKHHKGVHTLIAAWGQLSGPRLRRLKIYGSSIGEGQYHEQLSRQTQQYEGLTWEGPIRHDEVWGALAETDVLVVPSRWNENSPNVILEAQAMGIPVIGTNLGGIAELVQHGRNGLLFEPDDATDLAAQMRRLLDEPELLGLLSQNPNPFCSFLDEITQIQHLYEQLTGLLLPRIPLEHNVSRALSVLLFWLAAAVPMVI